MQANYWWVVPLVSFFSTIIGAATAFAGLAWRYRRDFRSQLLGELITTIQSAADLSTEYWLLDASALDVGTATNIRSLEARIQGLANRIDDSVEMVRPHFSKIDMLGIQTPAEEFSRNLTGGDFSVPD